MGCCLSAALVVLVPNLGDAKRADDPAELLRGELWGDEHSDAVPRKELTQSRQCCGNSRDSRHAVLKDLVGERQLVAVAYWFNQGQSDIGGSCPLQELVVWAPAQPVDAGSDIELPRQRL